jgi:hypothetical protein
MKFAGAITIGMMVVIGSFRPSLFDTRRAAKLTFLAVIVPGLGYGIKVIGA